MLNREPSNQAKTRLDESTKELIAIGASVGAHCQPCLEYHMQKALELGVSADAIREAVDTGHLVERGAMNAMKKYSKEIAQILLDSAGKNNPSKTLKIYDPAMCCASGVCGPSVDPVLAQFSGTLQSLSRCDEVTVERYNLGHEPQAFVQNERVKALLDDGGTDRLPFIFIDDDLAFQSRYPSREELFQVLGIADDGLTTLNAPAAEGPCCGEEGCC